MYIKYYKTAMGRKFKPTNNMIRFLQVKLDPSVKPTITAECKEAGISRETYYRWFENPDFLEWFEREFTKGMAKMIPYLDKVGMMKAVKDFRYWEAMQMKYGAYARQLEAKTNVSLDNIEEDIAELRQSLRRGVKLKKARRNNPKDSKK